MEVVVPDFKMTFGDGATGASELGGVVASAYVNRLEASAGGM